MVRDKANITIAIRKTVRASKKMLLMTLLQVHIRNRISKVQLFNLLDLHFQGQKFKILIYRKRYELAQKCPL